MPFARPTLTQIVTQVQSDITSRLPGSYTLLRRSILRVLARAQSGTAHLLYGNIDYNKDQLFITTADEEFLSVHGGEYGIPRNAATSATGSIIITGDNGKSIPAGSELESATNQVYTTDVLAVIAGANITVAVTATTPGNAGNEDPGAALSFVSPIPGVDSTAVVGAGGLDGGADREGLEAYRTRILDRKRRPPSGGAEFDYVTWMKEVTGVTRAWSVPLYQGVGTIGCAFVRDNDDDLIPSLPEIETVRSYIISHVDPITGKAIGVPVTAEAGLYMIRLNKLSVNMSVTIFPNTSTIRDLVNNVVADVILLRGGPGQAIYRSELNEAISSVAGEVRHKITLPSGLDYVTAATDQIHVPGTITFDEYT